MILTLNLVVFVFLLIISIIDWKFNMIPAILTTGIIFVVAVLNPINLYFGILSLIMAYLLFESKFFVGITEIKLSAIIGFMISSLTGILYFIILLLVFGVSWKALWHWRKKEDISFIPVFIFVYAMLVFLEVVR